jgi:hypothetical protein
VAAATPFAGFDAARRVVFSQNLDECASGGGSP